MKPLYWLLLGGLVLLVLFGLGNATNPSRGFYTADFAEYANTQDWYVASNTGLHAGTA